MPIVASKPHPKATMRMVSKATMRMISKATMRMVSKATMRMISKATMRIVAFEDEKKNDKNPETKTSNSDQFTR